MLACARGAPFHQIGDLPNFVIIRVPAAIRVPEKESASLGTIARSNFGPAQVASLLQFSFET